MVTNCQFGETSHLGSEILANTVGAKIAAGGLHQNHKLVIPLIEQSLFWLIAILPLQTHKKTEEVKTVSWWPLIPGSADCFMLPCVLVISQN